jgi:hypothetical protein
MARQVAPAVRGGVLAMVAGRSRNAAFRTVRDGFAAKDGNSARL